MNDPIVDEVRRVREELIERHGGLESYLRSCEQQDRRLARQGAKASQPKPNRRPTARARKLTKGHD